MSNMDSCHIFIVREKQWFYVVSYLTRFVALSVKLESSAFLLLWQMVVVQLIDKCTITTLSTKDTNVIVSIPLRLVCQLVHAYMP